MKNQNRDAAAAAELGDSLRILREQAGRPPYTRIANEILLMLGTRHGAPSDETIRRLHNGETDPWNAAPETLICLARFYDVKIDALGPATAERVSLLLEVASQNRKILALSGAPNTDRHSSRAA